MNLLDIPAGCCTCASVLLYATCMDALVYTCKRSAAYKRTLWLRYHVDTAGRSHNHECMAVCVYGCVCRAGKGPRRQGGGRVSLSAGTRCQLAGGTKADRRGAAWTIPVIHRWANRDDLCHEEAHRAGFMHMRVDLEPQQTGEYSCRSNAQPQHPPSLSRILENANCTPTHAITATTK